MRNENVNEPQNQQSCQNVVKSRFFAQYWGTKTLYIGGVGLVEVGAGGWNLKHPDFFLQLKPLSQAKRDDLLKAYYMIWEEGDLEDLEKDYKEAKEWFNNYGSKNFVKFNQEQVDFLRHNGYAIPFMGYSVQDLISFGWLQLL
jgi:hypothetical protein